MAVELRIRPAPVPFRFVFVFGVPLDEVFRYEWADSESGSAA